MNFRVLTIFLNLYGLPTEKELSAVLVLIEQLRKTSTMFYQISMPDAKKACFSTPETPIQQKSDCSTLQNFFVLV